MKFTIELATNLQRQQLSSLYGIPQLIIDALFNVNFHYT